VRLRAPAPAHHLRAARRSDLGATLPTDRSLPCRACPQLTEMEKTLAEAGVLGETIMQT